jgi:L-asparaginase/Glu-tRNA(Gln) amidotransferase subunit D
LQWNRGIRVKHICVITTGGTIDSVAAGGSLSVAETASAALTGLLAGIIGGRASHDVTSPLNLNSEDFSLPDIEAIAAAVEAGARRGHRLFLVTHGSDTLHFTAAALGLACAGRGLTICLAAAFRPLFEPGSDGPATLKAAVDMLLAGTAEPSTYVALKADGGPQPVAIADWREVKPLDFDSTGMERLKGRLASLPAMDLGIENLGQQGRHVRFLQAYVGLDSAVLSGLAAGADIVVIGAYHSGTLPSAAAAERGVIACVKAHPQTLFLLSRHPDSPQGYASARRFEAAGGILVRHLLPHQTYMLACLLRARESDISTIRGSVRQLSHIA